MRIISRKKLKEFWEHPDYRDSEQPLKAWIAEAKRADWKSPAEVKMHFGNGSVIKDSRFVFNIAGNKYRLVSRIEYEIGIIFIRFIGTHKQYDQIDAEKI